MIQKINKNKDIIRILKTLMIRTNSIGNLGIITVNNQTNNHVIFSATRDNHQKI